MRCPNLVGSLIRESSCYLLDGPRAFEGTSLVLATDTFAVFGARLISYLFILIGSITLIVLLCCWPVALCFCIAIPAAAEHAAEHWAKRSAQERREEYAGRVIAVARV